MMMPSARIALFLLAWATQALGGPFEDGVAAFDQQQYASAMDLWRPLADQGPRAAQFNVGILYEKGLGVGQDAAEAAKWYLEAAEQGDMQAQFNLGMLYETGTGVARNVDEARRWYGVILVNRSTDEGTLS